MQKETLLEVRNLVTQFKKDDQYTRAVDDISFVLNKGEILGIVGESGSGKSVTSLSVMRLIPNPPGKITGGSLLYKSRDAGSVDLASIPEEEMRRFRGSEIAMIFQEPMTSLNPVMRCGRQVMESIRLHDKVSEVEARRRTIELFHEVQLPDPEGMFLRYPHELSGGQKQRVMIAMAICCNPQLLIADEPTTALDVTIQKTILELLKKLQRQYGMGIIFITHDLGVIAELADKVVVMYKGKVVEQGNVNDIFARPGHPYTKSLLACRPPLDRRIRKLPVVSDFMTRDAQGTIVEKDTALSAGESAAITVHERAEAHRQLYSRPRILQLQNVSTWFPSRRSMFGKVLDYTRAVDDVSFDVYEGETLGLVGESGCGKTTLGRSILRLAPVMNGTIRYRDTDLLKLKEKEVREIRREMQIIFQDPYSSLNPRITIGNAIAEPLSVHGICKTGRQRKARVEELLSKVGLEPSHYGRYPHEFSGGQRQRICIARALALNPRFIICDESVSALDVSVQAQVLNLLNDLKKEFMFTYIFISHDLGVVKFMSDRMVVMKKGRIEEMGDPDEMYLDPKTEYTRRLINSIPRAGRSGAPSFNTPDIN